MDGINIINAVKINSIINIGSFFKKSIKKNQ